MLALRKERKESRFMSTSWMQRRYKPALLFVVAALLVTIASTSGGFSKRASAASAYIRLNQVGYISSESKKALVLASSSESGASFSLMSGGSSVFSGSVGSSL